METNPFRVMKEIYKDGGVLKFYKGFSAAITRQVMYGTVRLGGYKFLFNSVENRKGKVSTADKSVCSVVAATIASFVGNPADLILVRI